MDIKRRILFERSKYIETYRTVPNRLTLTRKQFEELLSAVLISDADKLYGMQIVIGDEFKVGAQWP